MTVNLLLSYAYYSGADLGAMRRQLVCGRMMIDSGAFTASTMGKPIDLEAYAEYLETWRGTWDYAVTLDVIGNPEQTRRNTRWLHSKGLPVLPVFTRNERLAEFEAMVRDSGYVCVGGGVGMAGSVVQQRIAVLQRRAEELGGGVHALGMGALSHVRRVRPYSADSSNLSMTPRHGSVRFFDGRTVKTVVVADKAAIRQHWQALRAHDIDVAYLASTGRMPAKEQRTELVRCMGLAYTSADEWVRQTCQPVPPPHNVPDPRTGPHTYMAVIPILAPGLLELDTMLHNGYRPPIWERHGWSHQCSLVGAA